jgi:hypothetical protein
MNRKGRIAMTMNRVAATACVLVIAGSTRGQGSFASAGIEVGKAFPDVRLPSMTDGKFMSIADFRGEKLLLHVFASW